jgi:hypothetical protein
MSKRKANPAAVPMRDLVERIKVWHAEAPMDPPGDMTLTAALTVLEEMISARLRNGWTIAELHEEFVRLGLLTSLTTFRVTMGQVKKAKVNPSTADRKPKSSKPSRTDDQVIDGRASNLAIDAVPSASNDRVNSLRIDPPHPAESSDLSASADVVATSHMRKSEDEATSTEALQQCASSTSDDVATGVDCTPSEESAGAPFDAARQRSDDVISAATMKPHVAGQAEAVGPAADWDQLLDKINSDFLAPTPILRKSAE